MTLGGVAATAVNVANSTQLTATTPPHAAGAVDVEVSNSAGQKITLPKGFTYEAAAAGAPTVTTIAPTTGDVAGGTNVTITGTGFAAGMPVTFGGTAATNINVTSPAQLTATTPAHDAGAVDVQVSNAAGQQDTLAQGFIFQAAAAAGGGQPTAAPTLTAIAPTEGSTAGGTDVTITGTGFAADDQVSFGGVAGANVTVTSDTQLAAKTPAHDPGVVDVVVSDSNGHTAALPGSFTFR